MSARKLLAGLVDELPAPERVEPLAFIEDELLPRAMAAVGPAEFVLTCVQAVWGPTGFGTSRVDDGDDDDHTRWWPSALPAEGR